MKKAIVCVGPRASGKSSFCEKVSTCHPTIPVVSRDQLLIEQFGSIHLNTYSGAHEYAMELLWQRVQSVVEVNLHPLLILDVWNGSSKERIRIVRKLRDLGIDKVTAWYFTTPVEQVIEWFWKKPGIAKTSEMHTRKGENLSYYSETAPARDYELFHRYARNINSDGFDEIIEINPLLIQPEQIFVTETALTL